MLQYGTPYEVPLLSRQELIFIAMEVNDLLKKQLDDAAWKELSGEFPWTLETLKKYRDKLDWESVSENYKILWTPAMLVQFKNWIDRKRLSWTDCDVILTPDCLEQFADFWDWSKLSGNESVPLDYETIDRFIDKWNWANLINQCGGSNDPGVAHLYGPEFLERYAGRIPADVLEESQLWFAIKEQRKKVLYRQIACGEEKRS